MSKENGFFIKVKQGVARTKQKAEDSFEQSRIRTRIKEVEKSIRKNYEQIGEAIYRSAKQEIEKTLFTNQLSAIEKGYKEQQELYFRLSELSAHTKGEEEADEQDLKELTEEAMQQHLNQAVSDISEQIVDEKDL